MYEQVLPKEKGFKDFNEAVKKNKVTYREEDNSSYVRIYKKDGMLVRSTQ